MVVASERRCCRVLAIDRSTKRYRPVERQDDELRAKLKELAQQHPKWGVVQLTTVVRREQVHPPNHKRVERLYREERLQLRGRRKKRPSWVKRGTPAVKPTAPNECWSMDFIHDALGSGRRIKMLTIVDQFSRESPALEVDTSIRGWKVAEILDRLAEHHALPREIVVDNGPEFRSLALDQWAYQRGVKLRFIEPGKPTQNAFIERFNGRVRDECLNLHWFQTLAEAKTMIEAWREEYNSYRPHGSLGGLTPLEFLSRRSEACQLMAG